MLHPKKLASAITLLAALTLVLVLGSTAEAKPTMPKASATMPAAVKASWSQAAKNVVLTAAGKAKPQAHTAASPNPWTQPDAANAIWTSINTTLCAVGAPTWTCFDIDNTQYATPPISGWPGYGVMAFVSYDTYCQATAAGGRRAYAIWMGVKNGNSVVYQLSIAQSISTATPGVCGP